MKLFQIEEPDGGPADPDAPGAAIGIDASGAEAVAAVSVGGNAVILVDRDGFEQDLPVPAAGAPTAQWCRLFEGARLRAERALARPVTHAVLVLAILPDAGTAARLTEAADQAGLGLLRLLDKAGLAPAHSTAAAAAAILAEELAPRPQAGPAPLADFS